MNRKKSVRIRVTEQELAVMREKANESGYSLSEYIRNLSLVFSLSNFH